MFRSIFFLLLITASFTTAQNNFSDIPQNGKWDFNPQKIWEISQAGDEEFGRPGEPRIGNDAILYLHDFDKKLSYIIAGDGSLIATFASEQGDNPEVERYINCFTVDDKVIIGAMDKLHFYNNEGKLLHSIPNNIFVSFPYALIDENNLYVGPGSLAGIPDGIAEIYLLNALDNSNKKFAEIILTDTEKQLQPGGVVVGLIPQIFMAYDKADRKTYFTKNSEYKIYRSDENGNVDLTFGRELPRKLVSFEERKEHMNFFLKGRIPDEQIDNMVQSLPDSLTFYHNMIFNDGFIYLFRKTGLLTENHSQIIDIFTKDGTYVYQACLEFGDYYFQNPGDVQIKDNIMYALLINKHGKKVVIKYKIDIPAMN